MSSPYCPSIPISKAISHPPPATCRETAAGRPQVLEGHGFLGSAAKGTQAWECFGDPQAAVQELNAQVELAGGEELKGTVCNNDALCMLLIMYFYKPFNVRERLFREHRRYMSIS